MITSRNHLCALLCGALLSCSSLPALADDTELFIATSNPLLTGAQPNILFVYDNSGSMDSEVLTQEPWNADTTFEGCYRANAIYFSTNGTRPACNSTNYFNVTSNQCAASLSGLRNVGTYAGRMLAWRSNQNSWVLLSANNPTRPVECQPDRGLHGATAGTYYAATGVANTPYLGNASREPAWNTDYTIWSGNWLNWFSTGGTVRKTRMEVVREVTVNLLQSLNGVNVGLMHFNDNQGGTVRQAITDIATSRTAMQDAVRGLNPETWTPLSETLYEAALYYMGRPVRYGNVGPVLSVGASRTSGTTGGTTYRQPITYACQKNYIVFLTDGLPTQDVDASARIRQLPDWAAHVSDATCSGVAGRDGECMSDLAEYLYRHDLSSTMPGLQNVTTYTIGFGVDLALGDTTFLQQTARKGGGEYFPAGDTATLQNALTQIVLDVLDDSTTFSTPTAPVNAFNRTQNLSDLYVSVFAPSVRKHWTGNLKKYRMNGNRVVDVNGNPAVDDDTGFFSSTSRSFWSDEVDGSAAQLGGAAHELPAYDRRNLYTDIAGSDLNATGNLLRDANLAVTNVRLNSPVAERSNVINWARGLDLHDEDDDNAVNDTRHVMGDPLHVRPVMVIYGGDERTPDGTVYVSTNDGYLHAIDPDDGSELWAFVPSEMLGRLYDLYLNDTTSTRTYGLDGEITVYVENDDRRGGISGSERVWLFFGMRRGGDTVYALDVTNRNDPQLMWKINSSMTGFTGLGQTWSPPSITTVSVGGTPTRVAIFGGGYNPAQDNAGYRTDTVGNSIYMVNAQTGALIWRAGNGAGYNLNLPQMTHSIPAGVRVLDLNQDRLADRMYVGDMGGRVWRFDIINGRPASTLVQGGVFASVGAANLASPTAADVRRFYATPDVALMVANDQAYFSINLGSGHREHPLDTATDDEFYALRDYNVYTPLANNAYTAASRIDRNELVNITGNLTPTIPAYSPGWRMQLDLSAGEKVVTESRTFQFTILFTTFSPGGNGDACIAAGGLNRLYMVSARDGAPRNNLDGSESENVLTLTDRSLQLEQGGIAPDPELFFVPENDDQNGDGVVDADDECEEGEDCTPCGNGPTVQSGPETNCGGFGSEAVRTRWTQNGAE